MNHPARVALALLMLAVGHASPGLAQRRDTLVIVTGGSFSLPVPGLSRAIEAIRISELLFLRLARHGATTSGDGAAVPELARSWKRLDSVTLAFELDPRARWHDGRPVTTDDVLFSFARMRDPKVSPTTSRLLVGITGVEADAGGRIVVRFNRPYSEQLYDATYHVQVLPRHLLAHIPADSIAVRPFATMPVGNGPYRVARHQPGESIDLVAVPDFFLGRPAIDHVVWRYAPSHEARLNMLLTGAADMQEDMIPPVQNLARVKSRKDLRVAHFPSTSVTYLLFNQRDPTDTTRQRPHPALSRPAVREALSLAIDRKTLLASQLAGYGSPSSSPAPAAAWYVSLAPRAPAWNPARARQLLANDGWRDTDGDGILERNGQRLTVAIMLPSSSTVRHQLAQVVEQQWRAIGVAAEVHPVEPQVFGASRLSGRFDVTVEGFSFDPSPWGMLDLFGCNGAANYARYCNPAADSALAAAHWTLGDPAPHLRRYLDLLASDHPAAFLYSRDFVLTIPKKYGTVSLHPESPYRMVWTWGRRQGD